MIDGIGRNIDYLRISVTDKCNLRCQYCMPAEGIQLMPHEELLTLEEIVRVCSVMAELGIKKIRLTGGEPLVRKNFISLVERIHAIPQIEDISITTNGILFAEMAADLKKAGLNRVNLSLDTLKEEVFKNITRVDGYELVMKAMKACIDNDLKLKINCVATEEFNKLEIEAIAGIAKTNDVDVRFIELMPIGCGKNFTGISSDEILRRLENRFGKGVLVKGHFGNGPASYYEFPEFHGKIGFISPMSHKFCSECNRVRLTSEGLLKLCLHYSDGIMLKHYLREEKYDDAMLKELIKNAIIAKPKSHNFEKTEEEKNSDNRKMYQIGG